MKLIDKLLAVLVAVLVAVMLLTVVFGCDKAGNCPACGTGHMEYERYTIDDLTYIDGMCDSCTYTSCFTWVE